LRHDYRHDSSRDKITRKYAFAATTVPDALKHIDFIEKDSKSFRTQRMGYAQFDHELVSDGSRPLVTAPMGAREPALA
jgi:hypothetical protein